MESHPCIIGLSFYRLLLSGTIHAPHQRATRAIADVEDGIARARGRPAQAGARRHAQAAGSAAAAGRPDGAVAFRPDRHRAPEEEALTAACRTVTVFQKS